MNTHRFVLTSGLLYFVNNCNQFTKLNEDFIIRLFLVVLIKLIVSFY